MIVGMNRTAVEDGPQIVLPMDAFLALNSKYGNTKANSSYERRFDIHAVARYQ